MMNRFQKSALAMAVSAVMFAPAAMAEGGWHFGASLATVDNEQDTEDNFAINSGNSNNADLDDSSLQNSEGNIGANVAAGDNNTQSNSAALAETDKAMVFGSSSIEADQEAEDNFTINKGSHNNASLGGSALSGAAGNIGANVASGNNNAQQNNLALAKSDGSYSATATVDSDQEADDNATVNVSKTELESVTVHEEGSPWHYHKTTVVEFSEHGNSNTASLGGSALSGASGNIGANVAAGTNNLQSNSLAVSSSGCGICGVGPTD